MLEVGSLAPTFEADSTQGKIRLGDYLGDRIIVLIFYPGDSTPGCTKQLCAVRDAYAEYERLGAVVFGINPAGDRSHRKFAERQGYRFPLIADRDQSIRKSYRVGKLLGLVAQQRVVYVIDKQGRIAYAVKGMPETSDILAAVHNCARN